MLSSQTNISGAQSEILQLNAPKCSAFICGIWEQNDQSSETIGSRDLGASRILQILSSMASLNIHLIDVGTSAQMPNESSFFSNETWIGILLPIAMAQYFLRNFAQMKVPA